MRVSLPLRLLPVLALLWLVCMGAVCPNGGTTPSDGGRTADIQGFLEISPASPQPNERVRFEVSPLTTNGNPDAYASWQIGIYRGAWEGPLPTQFQPGAANLIATIEKDGVLQPEETPNVRYRYMGEGDYTVVLYLSTSAFGGNRYRSAKRAMSVTPCDRLRVSGFKDTLTVGDGYDRVYRELEDMGHLLQSPGPDLSSIPQAVVGEAFSFDLKPFISTAGVLATFTLEDQDLDLGLSLSSSGILSGTPPATAAGLHWMRIRIADHCLDLGPFGAHIAGTGLPRDVVVRWPIRIDDSACPAFTILPAQLPNASLNAPYSQAISATGGTPPITFELLSGELPTGLTFDGITLAGMATVAGEFSFTIRGTDSCSEGPARVIDKTYVMRAIDPENCPEFHVFNRTLAAGVVGVPYDAELVIDGGIAPYSATLSSGTLPPGLSISSTNHVVGTPLTAGSFTFTVLGMDSCPEAQTDPGTYMLTITDPAVGCGDPPALDITGFPDGEVGVPFTPIDISHTGGKAPLTFAVSAGSLPPGLTLDSTGRITGTPTLDGTFNFTVEVTDSCDPVRSDTSPGSIRILPASTACPNLLLGDVSTDPATFGEFYTRTFISTGGQGTVSYFVVFPTVIPPGMTLNQSTGVFSGTPTEVGTFQFLLQVVDQCEPLQTSENLVNFVVNEP